MAASRSPSRNGGSAKISAPKLRPAHKRYAASARETPLRAARHFPNSIGMTEPAATAHPAILIIDFGSQVTQLIARRVREAGAYCEIVPFDKACEAFAALRPKRRHPFRRAGLGAGGGQPARAAGDIRGRHPGSRHLLRADDDGRAARRRGGERPPPRVRPRAARRDRRPPRSSKASGTPARSTPCG